MYSITCRAPLPFVSSFSPVILNAVSTLILRIKAQQFGRKTKIAAAFMNFVCVARAQEIAEN